MPHPKPETQTEMLQRWAGHAILYAAIAGSFALSVGALMWTARYIVRGFCG